MQLANVPIIPRCEYYEYLLLASKETGNFISTLDEHVLLIAQYLKRTKKIKDLEFRCICDCSGVRECKIINLDEDGDIIDEIPHGFFSQRLQYLR